VEVTTANLGLAEDLIGQIAAAVREPGSDLAGARRKLAAVRRIVGDDADTLTLSALAALDALLVRPTRTTRR
jgi:hypothetical protein